MKTVFVGGGPGCLAVLELAEQHRLATLSLDILGVVDINAEAPAMRYAKDKGWPTFTSVKDALSLPDVELIIELTGIASVRDEIYHLVPPTVRVMDHDMARVFWDLDDLTQHLRDELKLKTRLETEIRKDRQRLQQLLDSLPDVVMVVDAAGIVQRVNRRFEEVTGLNAVGVVDLPCSNRNTCRRLGRDGEVNTKECPRLQVLATGEPMTMVQAESCIGWHRPDRESFYEVTANPISNPDGSTSVVITSREVTEQILLKRETEQAARRFDQILAAVHGQITIRDLQGRYQVVNPRAAEFFGLPADALLGQTARQVLPPQVAALIHRNDAQIIASPGHYIHEETFKLDGEEQVLISERIMLYNHLNEPAAVCCVSRDVTEARRMQRELALSEKHAAVGKLAAGVAHEINNPLTGILTFAEELLEDAEQGSQAQADLQVILRETLRCRQIVQELLDFSRQTAPRRQGIPIKVVIDRALALVRNQAAFHDIEFVLELDEPRLRVQVDPNQIQQVMLNLVINARDSMDGKGEITIQTVELPDTGRVVVQVVDQGCGIADEALARVFEPFYSTKGDQGLGLGLAAVRSIIDSHNGEIEVESEPGEGAVFRISLPALEPDNQPGDSQ